MPKLPGVNHLDAVRALEKIGFWIVRQGKHVALGRQLPCGLPIVANLGVRPFSSPPATLQISTAEVRITKRAASEETDAKHFLLLEKEGKTTMEPWLIITLIVLGVLVLAGIAVYNGLVNKKVETENAWSQIDVQLKRRHDLIPNLVETVKGYATHEKDTLEKVVQARNAAVNARGVAEQAQAENALSGTLKTLFAVSEAYPDLKANQSFLGLQEELTATENRIGFARQHYNDVVGQYNAALMRFPSNILANVFGFRQVEFFQLDAAEMAVVRQAPQVKF